MKYTIITINYNNKEGLRRTIESVVNQTDNDYEYIIIDGGSTDGSVEVIKEYADKIDYWVSEPDKGIYNAMNKGIAQAHGEYLNFMNSGDCFYDKHILKIVKERLDCDIVIGKTFYENSIHEFKSKDITMLDFFKGHLNHQSAFIHKKLFKNKNYTESYKIISDWIFFIETLIYQNASFRNINIIVCEFESNGISKNNQQLINKERDMYLQQILPERILKDYVRWKRIDSPLSELISELNDTIGLQKLAKACISCIVKLKKIKEKNYE